MRDLDLNDPRVLDASLVVSASAGSGKTFTLSVLVTASLGREGERPFEILATTFGDAAASDLRERLLRPLDLLSALDEDAWRALLPLLGQPGGEAFGEVLKALPLGDRLGKSAMEAAQASALWGEVAWAASPARARAFWRRVRREAELLQVSTIHSLALGLLRQGEGAPEAILDASHPALLRLLRQTAREALTLPADHPDHVPAHALLTWAEKNWEALSQGHDQHRDAMGLLGPADTAPVREALLAALATAETAFAAMDAARAKNASSAQARHFKPAYLLRVPGPGADLARRMRWAETQSRVVRLKDNRPPGYFSAEFQDAYAALGPVADAWEDWLRCLLTDAFRRFEAQKAAHGQGTFGDLVRKALAGLREGSLEPPRPRLLLVDEYQDTSRAQDAFLEALGAGRTVRVGDLKQAIYGFRGGDPDLLRDHLEKAEDRAFRLPSNFRSAPAVVSLANHYVDNVWPQLDPLAGNLDGNQEPVSRSAVPVGLVRAQGRTRGSDLLGLAGWITALSVEDGWDQTLGRPAKPGGRRRALLLRQRTKLSPLLQILKGQGIRPYVVAKDGFWDSPGVRLVMAALEAVAHPERSLPCAALLRNVAGLRDGEITALAVQSKNLPGQTRGLPGPTPGLPGPTPGLPGLGYLDPAHVPEAHRDAVSWLVALRSATTQDLAGRLLAQGALLASVAALGVHGAMEPLRARRNLGALLSMIMDLPASPFAAYARLDEERSGKEKGDLPASAEGADLIIQTVHGSKGLEYDDVILPLLNTQPKHLKHGEIRTDGDSKALALAWKLGNHPGLAYRNLKDLVEQRQRRDDLNLLYVGCTRAKERMCLLLQDPGSAKSFPESKTWAQWGRHLVADHPGLKELEAPPTVARSQPPPLETPAPPVARTPLPAPEEAPPDDPRHGDPRARQAGEAMHAYLRDLLVRWEDPEGLQARLEAPPDVPHARENAQRFLDQFEAKGWRHLRRRTELPVAGAAASGAEGRADLVVWDDDVLRILDFKHSRDFSEEDLDGYRAQLRRYAEVLRLREGLPVEAWLIALRSGGWVRVDVG